MNLMPIGISELLFVLLICAVWLIPVAAAIWALVTLQRIRASQLEMQVKLNALEQLLKR